MKSRWIQGKIEEYSFLKLAQKIMPPTEFPVVSYPYVKEVLCLNTPEAEQARKKMIPQFFCVTKEEENAILDGKWDAGRDYERSDMKFGFYFMDVPMGCLEKFFPDSFMDEVLDELLKSHYLENDGSICFSKRLLVKAVFCILHEYGHYLDYSRFESKEEFALWVYNSKTKFCEYDKKVKNANDIADSIEMIDATRSRIYRECAHEHSADMYALENLDKKVVEAFEIICEESK
jgi:hypothetical protein